MCDVGSRPTDRRRIGEKRLLKYPPKAPSLTSLLQVFEKLALGNQLTMVRCPLRSTIVSPDLAPEPNNLKMPHGPAESVGLLVFASKTTIS